MLVGRLEEDRLREATAYYKESLAICREIGDKRGLVRALHNLAIVEREMGQLAEARAGFEESLAVRGEIGDTRGQVMGLRGSAISLAVMLGPLTQAVVGPWITPQITFAIGVGLSASMAVVSFFLLNQARSAE